MVVSDVKYRYSSSSAKNNLVAICSMLSFDCDGLGLGAIHLVVWLQGANNQLYSQISVWKVVGTVAGID